MRNILLPISAIVPTRNRRVSLERMLNSLARQSAQPVEMVVVDASTNDDTERLCKSLISGLETKIIYRRAQTVGAAAQRNQAIRHVSQQTIWFVDDDVIFKPDCLERLWSALQSDPRLGGVNAMIVNQKYSPPGFVSRLLFQFLNGRAEESYAGKCIGPALNLLPEDRPDLPEVVFVEWLNTTCTLYRREALPELPFPNHFTGYSMMEDVALSLVAGRQWKLANARTAQIFHESQAGDHKNNIRLLSEMELMNRHYVMTRVLRRQSRKDYFNLAALQLFSISSLLTSFRGWKSLPAVVAGNLGGLRKISQASYHRRRDAEPPENIYPLW